MSRDLSPIPTDDEELEPHRQLVSVMARWEWPPTEAGPDRESDFLFASFSPYFYKEKDGLSGATVVKLNISSLQSIEALSETPPYKVILHFNHPHPELRSRILLLEEDDLALLKELVEPIIVHNHQDEEARRPPPPCRECGLPFYGMIARHAGLSMKTNKYCRFCGNKIRRIPPTIQSTKTSPTAPTLFTPLASSDLYSEVKLNLAISSLPVHKRQHSRQKSTAHSSGSMTGSVCTAVDRLSSGSNTPLKARLQDAKEMRQPLVATSVTSSTNNTEDITFLSTSAKSTDTICHSVPTSLREALEIQSEDNADTKGIVFEDSNKKISLEIWSKNLHVCYTSYSIEWWEGVFEDAMEDLSVHKESTSIAFNFDDFSVVDHRVKLFCEVFLFKEKHELLQGLVKAIATVDNGKPFPSLLVISNRKIYVLQIVRRESNSPQNWLKTETVCFLDEVHAICTLFQKQGVLLHLRERFILVCLADAQRTSAVFSFIFGCMERFGFHPRVDDESSRLQSQSLRRHIPLDDSGQEPTIHLFQMVTLLNEGGECTNHFLVLTSSRVVLLETDLAWLVSSTSQEINSSDDVTFATPDLAITSSYALDDVTQIDVFSDTLIKMEFYQQRPNTPRPPWTIHLASPWATCNLIHTLRPLWMHLLKIDLALVCFSEDLCIVRELLRDTAYAKYLNSN